MLSSWNDFSVQKARYMYFCIIVQYNVLSYRKWVGLLEFTVMKHNRKTGREVLLMTVTGMYNCLQQIPDRHGTAVLTVWCAAFWLFLLGTGIYNRTSIHCTILPGYNHRTLNVCAQSSWVPSRNIDSVCILVKLCQRTFIQSMFLFGYIENDYIGAHSCRLWSGWPVCDRNVLIRFWFGMPLKTMRVQ